MATKITSLKQRRRGDNAKEAYIEFKNNKYALYEEEVYKKKLESGEILDEKKWENNVLK